MKTYLLTLAVILSTFDTPAQVITTFAGNNIQGYGGDGGPATAASFSNLGGIAFDAAGNLFVCDNQNNRIRKIDLLGIITTVAGTGIAGFSGDGGPAMNAMINKPSKLTFDAAGNLYFSDFVNDRIRKIDTAGIITTIAGNGSQSSGGDGGQATSAQLGLPNGIAFDAAGNLYIAQGNFHRIRKIDTAGIITTIAGTGQAGYNGDGIAATSAKLNFPTDITLDPAGNIYISEYFGNRIRKIDTSGIISTIAGTGTGGFNGNGIQATSAMLNSPAGMFFDVNGHLVFADGNNNRIRRIEWSGIITTIAGNGTPGYSGDGGDPLLAQLNYPVDVVLDAAGQLYISDNFNFCIRKMDYVLGIESSTFTDLSISVFPNPASEKVSIQFFGTQQTRTIILFNATGQEVWRKESDELKIDFSVGNFAPGIYLYTVSNNTNSIEGQGKLVVQ